jgi:hypothetical protein
MKAQADQAVHAAGEREKREAEELRQNVDLMLEAVNTAAAGDLTKASASAATTPSARWPRACRASSATCARAVSAIGRSVP